MRDFTRVEITLPVLAFFTLSNNWSQLWQRRTGHASETDLKDMKNMVRGVDVLEPCPCEPCVETRLHARPHK
jgi:hypothetical protein